jgi:uncharacterized protein with von Willebrand factor type A (vWA) domain
LGGSADPDYRRIALGLSERKSELKRRQKRRTQVTRLKKRLPKATKSEKVEIARKLRAMTPGAEVLIENWGLVEVDR